MLFDGRGERTAEEYRTTGIDLEQRVRSFSQIDGLDEPSVESLCLLDVSIEIGQALDVDQASSHGPARGLLMVCAFCQASQGFQADRSCNADARGHELAADDGRARTRCMARSCRR